jgi:hypothetical protein
MTSPIFPRLRDNRKGSLYPFVNGSASKNTDFALQGGRKGRKEEAETDG